MDEPNEPVFPYNIIVNFFSSVFSQLSRLAVILVLISNIVWAASAFYSLLSFNKLHPHDLLKFVYVTFILSVLNSSMVIIEIFNESAMSSLHVLLELMQVTLALPCLTTEVWLKKEVAQKEVAWLHTIIGLIPTYIFLFQHYTRQDLIDFTVVMNLVSLTGVGVAYRDIYPLGSAFLMFLAYAFYMFRTELSYEPIPRQFYSYCMALFTFCAFKSVT